MNVNRPSVTNVWRRLCVPKPTCSSPSPMATAVQWPKFRRPWPTRVNVDPRKSPAVWTQLIDRSIQHFKSSLSSTDFKGKKVTLLFDGQHHKTSLVGSDSLAVEVLKQLTKESETEFSARIPSLFSRLVTVLRPLSYAQLSSIFRNTQDARAK